MTDANRERIEARTQEQAQALAEELARKIRALLLEHPGVTMRGWDDGSTWVDVEHGPPRDTWKGGPKWLPTEAADVSSAGEVVR